MPGSVYSSKLITSMGFTAAISSFPITRVMIGTSFSGFSMREPVTTTSLSLPVVNSSTTFSSVSFVPSRSMVFGV